jgi:hypothetical protein
VVDAAGAAGSVADEASIGVEASPQEEVTVEDIVAVAGEGLRLTRIKTVKPFFASLRLYRQKEWR